MKVVYLMRNPGIARCTPAGFASAVIRAGRDGSWSDADRREVRDADAFVVGLEPVGEDLLAAAPGLKLVQRVGVGHDNVDVAAAARRGVPVCNMPDFNAGTVAEHTLMLVLALLRRVFESSLLMKSTHWPLGTVVGQGLHDLQGRTLGLVGLGRIGAEVARRARAFDAELVYCDPDPAARARAGPLGARGVALAELLERADVVSLHAPYRPANHHLIGRAELAAMKPTALLVNTARGALVDEDALAEALAAGRIAGAGLDVFAEEPLPPDHPLRRAPNTLLTPHTAGQTREAMDRMVAAMRENLERLRCGGELLYRVDPAALEEGGA